MMDCAALENFDVVAEVLEALEELVVLLVEEEEVGD